MSQTQMRAIVISTFGEPDVLREERRPVPDATPGTVVVRNRAFGLNHAETYFRRGLWGDVPRITGIECAGEVHDPGGSKLARGQRVFALLGGMGRDIDGSYAEYVRIPETNVVAIESSRDWVELAAIPESFATAWVFLKHNLELRSGQTLVVRGGTSALGQAAIQLARGLDARVFATTRSRDKAGILESLGAEPLLERPDLSGEVRKRVPAGVDAVFELVGVTTLVDSLKMVRYRGRVAMGGFLGGQGPIVIDPLGQFPSGAQLSFLASPFVIGTPELPVSEIPFAEIVARAECGVYRVAPAHVFDFGEKEMVEAHRLIESGAARGKIVVRGTTG